MQAQLVKKLRELTGSSIIHCKKALEECKNNIPEAQEWLRLKGMSQAHKKLNNSTGAGLIGGILTPSSGFLLELLCETDFVAKTDAFQNLTKDILTSWSQSSASFETLNTIKLLGFNTSIEEAKLQTISKTQENVIIRRGIRYESSPTSVLGLYLHNTIDPLLGLSGCLMKLRTKEPVLDNKEKVKQLAYQLSMQVIAGKPLFLSKKDVPEEFIKKETTAIEEQLDEKIKSKPKEVVEGIVRGKVMKAVDQVTLSEQVFVISEESEEKQVKKVVEELGKEISNEIVIEAYSTFACERINS